MRSGETPKPLKNSMKCVTCGFEIMPGSDACGRCGTSMRLATAVMDCQPPRAGKFKRKLRRVLPARKIYYTLRDGVAGLPLPRLERPRFALQDEVPPWSVTWRMIVPGWPHFHGGYRLRGHLFLWSFLASLLIGLIGMGTVGGAFVLGLAFSVHTSAALDAYNLSCPGRDLRRLLLRSMATMFYIGLIVYFPATALLTRGADARTVDVSREPFQRGDVLLINHTLHRGPFPRVGQVVMYEIPMTQIYETFAVAHVRGYIGGDT